MACHLVFRMAFRVVFHIVFRVVFIGRDQRRYARGVVRVEKAGGFGQARDQTQIADGALCVREPRRQPRSRIGGQAHEQRIHALDFGALIVDDIGGEIE